MENNGKTRKTSSLIEQKKFVIRLFSSYCKDRGWGKVIATRNLAHYYYQLDTPKGDKDREDFVDKWVDKIEAVINKPTKTTLRKYEELFDYIDRYLYDVAQDQYFDEFECPGLFEVKEAHTSLSVGRSFEGLEDVRKKLEKKMSPVTEVIPQFEFDIVSSTGLIIQYSGSSCFKVSVFQDNTIELHKSKKFKHIHYPKFYRSSVNYIGYMIPDNERINWDQMPSIKGVLVDTETRQVFQVYISGFWGGDLELEHNEKPIKLFFH